MSPSSIDRSSANDGEDRKLSIAFAHPDLGVGGAERLVAVAVDEMVRRGHGVSIWTSYYDSQRSLFSNSAKTPIFVHGSWIPRHILNKFHLLFAVLKSVYLALCLLLLHRSKLDILFVDQVSQALPIYRLCATSVVFFCHFPDALIAESLYESKEKSSFLMSQCRRIYRWLWSCLEAYSLSFATSILVNSHFTKQAFFDVFGRSNLPEPKVVYFGTRISDDDDVGLKETFDGDASAFHGRRLICSLNRFEKKKNVVLAIKAFAALRDRQIKWFKANTYDRLLLVVAGGYDDRLKENVENLRDLHDICDSLNLQWSEHHNWSLKRPLNSVNFNTADVLFLTNVDEVLRSQLLFNTNHTKALVYTPSDEHFGIVPLEAMSRGVPVIALASGGPLETIIDEQTGFLVSMNHGDQTLKTHMVHQIADRMHKILVMDRDSFSRMSLAARQHVKSQFSESSFGDALEEHFDQLVHSRSVKMKRW